MKKLAAFLVATLCVSALYAEELQSHDGPSLSIGSAGKLDVEAKTTFAYDLESGKSGLDTNVGMNFVFDLIPHGTYGLNPTDTTNPVVRLSLKNAAFTWWNSYYLADDDGANWDQDNVNKWTARPLVLNFDSFTADVVWKEYYFRVASTETKMSVNMASIDSIFDDVMDADDRWYIDRHQALYWDTRYNSLKLPLLGSLLDRDYLIVDDSADDNNKDFSTPSGMLGLGMEGNKLTFDVKAASYAAGADNNENAWMFGLDAAVLPLPGLKVSLSGLAAVNYDKIKDSSNQSIYDNPYSGGLNVEYLLPLAGELVLKPFAGFDYDYLSASEVAKWEAGGGAYLYFRGTETKASHRDIDFDAIIPVGLSISANYGDSTASGVNPSANAVFSLFELADEDALVPNLGGFAQVEVSNITDTASAAATRRCAAVAQVEYSILGKIMPYLQGKFVPTTSDVDIATISSKIGVYITPIKNFTIEVSYQRSDVYDFDSSDLTTNDGVISTAFCISM